MNFFGNNIYGGGRIIKKVKVVIQDGIKDCGICSLLSIIRYYGGDVSKEYLRELTNTNKDGVTLYDLYNAATMLGFEAYGMNGKIENINVNNLPCIVHFRINKSYQHFVVLYDIDINNNKVTIMDPSKGKEVISIGQFNILSTNNYLFLTPTKALPLIKNNNIINKLILKSFNKKIYVDIILISIITFLLTFILSFSFKYFLEYTININLDINILVLIEILIIITIFKNINILIRNILLNKWINIFDDNLTTNTYKRILLLPYLYYKNRTTGEVISRFRDLNTIKNYLSLLFSNLFIDILYIVIFISIMFNYSTTLTILVITIFIINVIIILLSNKHKHKNIKKLNRYNDYINTYLIEGLSNVDTIKGSHIEKRLIDKFNINYKKYLESIYKHNLFIEIINLLKNNLNEILTILIYGVGSYLVINNKLTLSNLIIYESLSIYLNNSLNNILLIIEELPNYKTSKERIEEVYMLDIERFNNNYFYLSYKLDGDIIYNNLTYTIGTKTLFNNLSLTILKGQKVLLTGSSGSGKSTLMKILLKYIEVPYNTVKISGIDISFYHLENIRHNITYITSNEYIFNDTIKNNITMYKEYSKDDIDKVVEICNINEIIKDSNLGIEKHIEENGFNFSTGERQRIVLARSIIRKSNIYIFDEALGGIDTTREKKILKDLFNYLKDKTIIIISHRSSNKKLYDRVLNLKEGKIYEEENISK